MIKLIVSDLDGTLLNKYQQISPTTAKVIKECENYGIEFMMATGRDYNMVVDYLEEWDLHCDLILNNGTQYMSKNHQDIRYFPMPNDKLREVIAILQKYDFHISMHTTKGKYIFEDFDEYYDHHFQRIQMMRQGEDIQLFMKSAFFRKDGYLRNTTHIDCLEEMFEQGARLLKIDADCDDLQKGELANEELKQVKNILLSTSYAQYVEVCSDQSHKGSLLMDICKEKGYQKDEVCVFGDSTNDIQMLQLFENSFVPCNGHEKAKEIGKYIISGNDDDGVAKAIIDILEKENHIKLPPID